MAIRVETNDRAVNACALQRQKWTPLAQEPNRTSTNLNIRNRATHFIIRISK